VQGKPRRAFVLPNQGRESESESSGEADGDSEQGRQLDHGGLGARTTFTGEEGSADSDLGAEASDAEDSGSVKGVGSCRPEAGRQHREASALRHPVPRLPAMLLQHLHIRHHHPPVHGLAHVVFRW